MADIEELGGLLVGEEVQWGEEALCFLDYAHDADQALTAAQIIPNRPPEPCPKVKKTKRACDEANASCWPIPTAAVTPVSSCQPYITTVEKAVDDGEDSDDANESRTVGSRGTRSYASRMERKATREKMRRLELNDKFNELAEILLDVEPCRHAQSHSGRHSRAPTDKGNFRVELLGRAIRTLKTLSEQAKAERGEVERLSKELEALKVGHTPQQPTPVPQMPSMPSMPQMAPMPMPQGTDSGSKKQSAPMWVTVPVWMPGHQGNMGGVKPGQPMPHSSYSMAMPLYMPQHAPQADGSSTPSSLSSASTVGPNVGPELNKNLPFNMPVFPPMPFMHHPGFGPVTMVPPPQVDEQQEAPTHAPCA